MKTLFKYKKGSKDKVKSLKEYQDRRAEHQKQIIANARQCFDYEPFQRYIKALLVHRDGLLSELEDIDIDDPVKYAFEQRVKWAEYRILKRLLDNIETDMSRTPEEDHGTETNIDIRSSI